MWHSHRNDTDMYVFETKYHSLSTIYNTVRCSHCNYASKHNQQELYVEVHGEVCLWIRLGFCIENSFDLLQGPKQTTITDMVIESCESQVVSDYKCERWFLLFSSNNLLYCILLYRCNHFGATKQTVPTSTPRILFLHATKMDTGLEFTLHACKVQPQSSDRCVWGGFKTCPIGITIPQTPHPPAL